MSSNRLAAPRFTMLLIATSALVSTTGQAQERSPYYIGLSQTLSHDDNVYRTASPLSETISSTGVVAGLDQQIGRQRLYGDLTAQAHRYNRLDQLNNESYSVDAGIDWETVQFLSGQLRYSMRNSLADFGTQGGSTIPSDQVSHQFLASARYGVTSRLQLEAGYDHRRLEFSAPSSAARENTQNTINTGVRWGTADLLMLGLGYRLTNGTTPHAQPTPPYEDKFKRHDIDLSVAWTPTGASSLTGRLSSTRETHSLASSATLNALTGSLSWNYRPTSKLNFTTSLVRDTGTETTFLTTPTSGSAGLQVDNSRLSNVINVRANYLPTSKVSVSADAQQRKGKLPDGSRETVSGGSLGLSFAPLRSTSLSCQVMHERRDGSSMPAYSATVTSCSAQITLR